MAIIEFRYDVPLEHTMAFEEVYPEPLRLDLADKQHFWDTPGALFAWMFVNNELAGETYGVPFDKDDEFIEPLTEYPDNETKHAVHCYSNTILPSFHNQGFGTILKAHWLGLAAAKGFNFVYGHARHGASQALNAKFGAEYLASFANWYGTGEEYKLYRLALR